MPQHTQAASQPRARSAPNDIEIGWLLLGRLEAVDRDAVTRARDTLLALLSHDFPDYTWKMPMVERRDLGQSIREEPTVLLDAGMLERDARHWDFVFVITGADLVSHYKPFALAAPSRAMGVAVISTVRIDPLAGPLASPEAGGMSAEQGPESERCALMSRRLHILGLHVFGHLNGLEHDDAPDSAMHDFQTVTDLDAVRGYSEQARARLAEALPDVADLRLEEQRSRRGRFHFYLRAAWRQRDDIASAIRHAAPWKLPLRLSRLTTAALSAVVVLINTAETWELALAQSPLTIAALGVLVVIATTWYVVKRQGLLLERTGTRLTEQIVITRLSATLSVGLGMLSTYIDLYALTALLALAVFPGDIVAGWSGMSAVSYAEYLLLAGFLSALGIAVGALGASFERQHYVRHVTFVDEET